MRTVPKCKPHRWATPTVGDRGLTCGRCGRHMDFHHDIHPNTVEILAAAYRRLNGEEAADRFEGAMEDAMSAYRLAHNNAECVRCAGREAWKAERAAHKAKQKTQRRNRAIRRRRSAKGSGGFFRRQRIAKPGRYFDLSRGTSDPSA